MLAYDKKQACNLSTLKLNANNMLNKLYLKKRCWCNQQERSLEFIFILLQNPNILDFLVARVLF
jgi:hypothetical protein